MNSADIFLFSQSEKRELKRLSIAALILFGSRAQGLESKTSDYDIGIIVSNKTVLLSPEKRRKIYDALYDLLASQIKKLVNIDIVFLETAPAELQAHAMRHGKVIFELLPSVFTNFKERVMLQYSDFAPLRKIFHRGILSRIP